MKPLLMFRNKARLNLKDNLYSRRLVTLSNATKMQSFTSDQRYNLEIKQFMDTFPIIVDGFINNPNYKDIPEVLASVKDMVEYTIPTGKRPRAIALVRSYKSLENSKNLTAENIKLANILGWCVELLHNGNIILDDMIDGSQVRRGVKCWYKKEGVGSRAIVEAILLESYINQLLQKHFSHLPMYVPAMHLIQETIVNTALGEVLNFNTKGSIISNFTRIRFQTITKYNTTPSSFELPYGLARCLSNKFHTEIPPETRKMLIKLGEFFRVQDDFSDCYNDRSEIGNDIANGQCSWLVVVALEKANFEERRLLENHYGKKDDGSVKIVKELYDAMEIPKVYAMYEEDTFKYIEKNIDEVSKLTCPELMFKRLGQLY